MAGTGTEPTTLLLSWTQPQLYFEIPEVAKHILNGLENPFPAQTLAFQVGHPTSADLYDTSAVIICAV